MSTWYGRLLNIIHVILLECFSASDYINANYISHDEEAATSGKTVRYKQYIATQVSGFGLTFSNLSRGCLKGSKNDTEALFILSRPGNKKS